MGDVAQSPATSVRPAARMGDLRPYRATRPRGPIDLWLDANEGTPGAEGELARVLASVGGEAVRRYPDASALERIVAERWGVDDLRVLVTAGGDDAINRLCLATLEPGRALLQHTPTFTMIKQSARLAGADVLSVGWRGGAFPLEAFCREIVEGVGLVAMVTPNNPTGTSIGLDEIGAVAARASEVGAVVLVDLAYAEFADEDPTARVLAMPNCVVVRTLSKAWSMAGLRVGYLVGGEGMGEVVEWCRAAGGPFAVSGVSVAVASGFLRGANSPDRGALDRVRTERVRLAQVLEEVGAKALASDANFVLGEWRSATEASWVRDALASLGIWVRGFSAPDLAGCLRITCPGDDDAFERLEHGLRASVRPEAVLFDLDGVIADVSASYRSAIVRTVESFGGVASRETIGAAKRAGDANNDWVLSRRLLSAQGIERSLEAVTARFESFYQGDGTGEPGLWRAESLLTVRGVLERIRARVPLGVVTGRPRRDAERFLEVNGIADLFDVVVCMEDGAPKPAPDCVRCAMERMGTERAWMVGDTVDDIRAARAAGVVSLGVVAPGDDECETTDALLDAGAARVLESVERILELLP